MADEESKTSAIRSAERNHVAGMIPSFSIDPIHYVCVELLLGVLAVLYAVLQHILHMLYHTPTTGLIFPGSKVEKTTNLLKYYYLIEEPQQLKIVLNLEH